MHSHQGNLFEIDSEAPIAESKRPQALSEIIGQKHFLNAQFERMLTTDRWTGLIFGGPPGTGKTTLAKTIAKITKRPFHCMSAVKSGVKEFREVLDRSVNDVRSGRSAHILFIDEVHRLNKAQQDLLLPFLEEGSIRFIGATTENPSFEINNAICSRTLIYTFKSLSKDELEVILKRALRVSQRVDSAVIAKIAEVAKGDARRALNLLESLILSVPEEQGPSDPIDMEAFDALCQSQNLYYDKHSDRHYDTISAFIKSVRGSDPDAALYYLARMLEGGEDPLFIARRIVILASEDIGNAQPTALVVANAAFQAVHAIGMPEGRIVLAQATTYLACCEKSNAAYVGIDAAIAEVQKSGELEIPYSIRNAVNSTMKNWGYGDQYKYAHHDPRGWVSMQFLPDGIKDKTFYHPSNLGREKVLKEFLVQRGKKYPK